MSPTRTLSLKCLAFACQVPGTVMLLVQIIKDHPREPPHVLAILRMQPTVDMLQTIVRPLAPVAAKSSTKSRVCTS